MAVELPKQVVLFDVLTVILHIERSDYKIISYNINFIITLFHTRMKIKIALSVIFSLLASYLMSQESSSFLDPKYNSVSETEWLNEYEREVHLSEDTVKDELLAYTALKEFSFSADHGTAVTWGRGEELGGVYFDERLPSFFKRRIEFDTLDLKNGTVEWIFTGQIGGFSLTVANDTVWLYQRFYDSFGLNQVESNTLYAKRHPEKIWISSGIAYKGALSSLEINVTHQLELVLFLNGVKAAKQRLFFDITAHQLRCSDKQVNIKGSMQAPKANNARIRISQQQQYQEILGFGGIAISTAYNRLSAEGKKHWWRILKENNLLLHREYPIGQKLNLKMDNWDNVQDATIHYYGDNFPNSEISDFEYIKKIQDIGGYNIFEFWRLPLWIQSRQEIDMGLYAQAMVNYCETAKEKTGKAPLIVGIQNEVNQRADNWRNMTMALRNALDSAGFNDVKIHMHNNSFLSGGIAAAKVFKEDPRVWDAIDYSASNMYDYQRFFMDPDGYDDRLKEFAEITKGKPFLSTELSINLPEYQIHSYRLAFQMGQLYYKNLTIVNASALMYCWTLLNNVQYSYDMTRSLFGVDESNGGIPASFGFQDRVFTSFSRKVMQGMHRVGVETTDEGLLAVAFYGNSDQEQTLILMNRSMVPIMLNEKDIVDFRWKEITSQYFKNAVTENVGNIAINPGEIITFFNSPMPY